LVKEIEMNKSKVSRARQVKLSDSMQQRLGVYAMAATAAGVGIGALAPAAEAKIVYTPAHEKILYTSVPLDLNHDGVTDFTLSRQFDYARGTRCGVFVSAPGGQSAVNKVWGNQEVKIGWFSSIAAFALPAGVIIGPKGLVAQPAGQKMLGRFFSNIGTGEGTYRGYYGPWANDGKGVTNRFLGLAFVINGETHYGWARLNQGGYRACTGLLTGYAYETTPNKAIATGQTSDDAGDEQAALAPLSTPAEVRPATLGALAWGSPGLALWRRDEEN
jgi:hypothetical protein